MKDIKKSIENIRIKYPNKIPLFIYRSKKDKTLNDISNNKFLVPESITVAQFMVIVRRRLNISEEISIFIFVNNTIPCSSDSISSIYETHKNKDGMLVLEYCGENVFG